MGRGCVSLGSNGNDKCCCWEPLYCACNHHIITRLLFKDTNRGMPPPSGCRYLVTLSRCRISNIQCCECSACSDFLLKK